MALWILLLVVLGAPLLLLPAAFVWYLNVAGIVKLVRGRIPVR